MTLGDIFSDPTLHPTPVSFRVVREPPRNPRLPGTPYEPTSEELTDILEDVRYEIDQLVALPRLKPEDRAERNAHLESALIHIRNLLAFFEPRWSKLKPEALDNDDVRCSHFDFPATEVPLPPGFRERLHRSLAHLSYSRLPAMTDHAAVPRPVFSAVLERSAQFATQITDSFPGITEEQREVWRKLLLAISASIDAKLDSGPQQRAAPGGPRPGGSTTTG